MRLTVVRLTVFCDPQFGHLSGSAIADEKFS